LLWYFEMIRRIMILNSPKLQMFQNLLDSFFILYSRG